MTSRDLSALLSLLVQFAVPGLIVLSVVSRKRRAAREKAAQEQRAVPKAAPAAPALQAAAKPAAKPAAMMPAPVRT